MRLVCTSAACVPAEEKRRAARAENRGNRCIWKMKRAWGREEASRKSGMALLRAAAVAAAVATAVATAVVMSR